MALFVSNQTNKIDRKGRVSVPARFRQALAQATSGIFVFEHFSLPCLSGVDELFLADVAERIDGMGVFSDNQEAFATSVLASAQQLTMDSEGRVSLPEELRHYAGITDQVTFVGMGKTFQIWEPEAFLARRIEQRDRAAAQARDQGIKPAGGG